MGELEAAFYETIQDAPRQLLKDLLLEKLQAAGAPNPGRAAADLSKRLWRGVDLDVRLEMSGDEDITIQIEVKPEEIDDLTRRFETFVAEGVPAMIRDVRESTARSLRRRLAKDWPAQKGWQDEATEGFRARLKDDWGRGFDLVRQMLTICRELGGELAERQGRSRSKTRRHRRDVLRRLHVRACQVVDEVLALMACGFADGAMARWRTLYEIDVVATLVARFGDDMAKRYLDHTIVESMRELETYEECHEALGFRPIAKAEARAVRRRYAEVEARYGKTFVQPYGWAAHHLGTDGKRFIDLEKAAGAMEMRAFYKFASQNVHAGAKGATFRLGLNGNGVLAGASNIGFVDPGQNAALSLVSITRALLSERIGLDEQVCLQVLADLQRQVGPTLMKAQRRIERRETELRARAAKPRRRARG